MKKSIIDYFFYAVSAHPGRLAVIDGDISINFAELDVQSKQLASALLRHLPKTQETSVVAFYHPKSIKTIVGNIACSMIGGAYMNLDIKSPDERLRAVLKNVQPCVIVTDVKHQSAAQSIAQGCPVLLFESLIAEGTCLDDKALECSRAHLIDTDLYCLINTSGSTGKPKSVALNHRSFLDFMAWTESEFGFELFETVGSLSPAIFDIYSFELCLLIMRGSTLVLIPESYAPFPVRILELLKQREVSFIFWVPSIMVNIANLGLLKDLNLKDLKLCWFAGEVFPTQAFKQWQNQLPKTEFVNLYGPIEITLDCTFYRVLRPLRDDESIPIGKSCNNTNILLLNEANQQCAQGEEGELCVRGSSLALGYYRQLDKTREVFVQNPLNNRYPEIIYRTGDMAYLNTAGEIIFKGRKDSLIKHNGYRIELSEIEHLLINKLKAVKNCCVIYNATVKEIVLFYEPIFKMNERMIREKLALELPKYMLPTRYQVQDSLPMNANGKIDRQKLKLLVESI
jgi:amino acid adenylation domain-containing protein